MAKKGIQASGIGGQAVLEGVMMKNKESCAIAVRKPDGEIDIEVNEYHGVMHGSILTKIPFVRGVIEGLEVKYSDGKPEYTLYRNKFFCQLLNFSILYFDRFRQQNTIYSKFLQVRDFLCKPTQKRHNFFNKLFKFT